MRKSICKCVLHVRELFSIVDVIGLNEEKIFTISQLLFTITTENLALETKGPHAIRF